MMRLTLLTMFQVSLQSFHTRLGNPIVGKILRTGYIVHPRPAFKLAVSTSQTETVSQLLRVLSGQKLSDLSLTASLAESVRLLDVNLSRESLDAWRAFDNSLCSSSCPYTLLGFLSRKVLPVPEDIEHSHCKPSTAAVCNRLAYLKMTLST